MSLISAGARHTCAITAAGLRRWGANDYGQIGDKSAWYFPVAAATKPISGPVL